MASSDTEKKVLHAYLPEKEPFKTTLTAGNHELVADEPDEVEGGKDRGPDPYDYLLMSLASCTLMTVKMYARRKEWPVEDLYLELQHHKSHADDCEDCEEPRSRIDVIEKELIIKGDLDRKQLDRLNEISQKCPVHRTLLGEIRIDSTVSRV